MPKSGLQSWTPFSSGSTRILFRENFLTSVSKSSPLTTRKSSISFKSVAAVLRGEIEAEERKSANVERFLSVVERYTEIPELTPCILHEFVEKIVVHAASDPKGKNRTQEIDIYYKGIGALEVSKVTSSRQE